MRYVLNSVPRSVIKCTCSTFGIRVGVPFSLFKLKAIKINVLQGFRVPGPGTIKVTQKAQSPDWAFCVLGLCCELNALLFNAFRIEVLFLLRIPL